MRLWLTALRIAARDARASALKFVFVAFGVAAGVGALTGVRGFSAAFHDALKSEARTLLAADLAVRVFSMPDAQQEAALKRWTDKGATLTHITETFSMLGAGDKAPPALVSVKAVDPALYPFYGQVKLEPAASLRSALTDNSIVVSDDLVVRLNLQPGSMLRLGGQDFRAAGIVRSEPDKMTGSLNVGPRVMITREALERTGLLIEGSRASQRFLLRLPAGMDPAPAKADLKKAFPEGRVVDARETHPAIERALDRSTTFLSLVSLIALIVGALGVATAIYSHLQQRLDTIAVMKCLGARSSQIIRIYTLETMLLGLTGAVFGVAVGAVVQRLFPLLLGKYFQFERGVSWSPAFALEGIGAGVLVTLLFTLPPLLSIRQIRPALIFRREMAETRPGWRERLRTQWPAALCGLLILAGLGAIAGWLAESAKMGSMFIGGLAVSLLVLAGVAWLLLRGLRAFVRRAPFRLPVEARQGIANLYRPGNHAGAILVSLGVGVMFTLTIYLIQNSLLREVAGAAPPNSPNVFMINVTQREYEGVRQLLDSQKGLREKPRLVPLVAVRMTAIDGKPVKAEELKGFNRRFAMTRQMTWSAEMPADLQIRKGQWWTKDSTESLVSLGEEAADALKVGPGALLRWNVTGREFDARVAAVYRVQSVGPGNFSEMIFSPKALEGYPTQYLGTARLAPAAVSVLQREAYRRFPTVTVINAADVMSIIQEVVDQVSLVVRFISAFAILAGAIILAATVAGTRLRRIRESAVLKTIGARRRRLVGIFSVEFLILGGVAGLMGGALATLFTRVLLTRLLDAPFRMELLPNLVTIVLTALLATGAGWLASLRVLNQKPLEVLRDE